MRTGAYAAESLLTPERVDARRFGKVFSLDVEGDVYAQPLVVHGVPTASGRRDLAIVATESDRVYAFDAVHGGAPVWQVALAAPERDVYPLEPRDVHCPLIEPAIGITSTPVIDARRGVAYVLARTKEGDVTAPNGIRFVQRLHALDVGTGAEALGGPVEIRAAVRTTRGLHRFDAQVENQRPALLLANGAVYIAWGGSCDSGPYRGWIMAYDMATLQQLAVFDATPTAKLGGIWQADAGLAADDDGAVYAITGNGRFDADAGGRNFGNSVIALRLERARGRLVVKDYFTPSAQRTYDAVDADLGSQGPVLTTSRTANGRRLLVFASKGTGLYVLDRHALGRYHNGHDEHAYQHGWTQLGFCYGAVAAWRDHVYVACAGDVLRDYRFVDDRLGAQPVASAADTLANSGATPAVSARGAQNGIVWLIDAPDKFDAPRAAVLRAYDASDVRRKLYDSEQNAGRDRAGLGLRFALPTIDDGRVYVARVNGVDVYGALVPECIWTGGLC